MLPKPLHSLQAVVVGGSGDKSQSSNTSSNYVIHTVETDSIESAINIANAYMNKSINLSHCKMLVVSEEIAKEGIEGIINSLMNNVEIRPDCNIIVSKIPQGEFDDNSKMQINEVLSKYYDVTSNVDNKAGYSEAVKLSHFYYRLNDYFYQPYSTLGITTNSKADKTSKNEKSNLDVQSRSLTSTPKEDAVETIGLAVFKNDTLVGTLSANQTLCHQLITDNVNYCTINIPNPFNSKETMDLYLSSAKCPKIKVKIINGSPFIEINIYLTARVMSFNDNDMNTLTEGSLKTIKTATTQFLQSQVYDYLDKTSKELNCDIAGFGRYAAMNFITAQEWEDYNWLENFRNSTFKVNIDVSVKSGQLLTSE